MNIDEFFPPAPPQKTHEIAELVLHTGARVNRFEEKAAFVPLAGLSGFATPPVGAADALRKSDVVTLTGKMTADGRLTWTPPPGKWIVCAWAIRSSERTTIPRRRKEPDSKWTSSVPSTSATT